MNEKELTDPLELVGTRIDGKYLIAEVVDRTSLSIVYRGTHLIWKRDVAIKVFSAASTLMAEARDAMIASFVREGALLAELTETCSAICQAREIGSLTTPGGDWMPYMVLEWLDGESLEALLSRERASGTPPRSIQQVVCLLGPIADALGCAHTQGIVHCDVKPGNMILLHAGQPRCKLLDFGIAKVVRGVRGGTPSRPAILERAFTPGFGAPEQFDAAFGETGPWTDVFALALVVVEMMCGREALQGQEVAKLGQESCDRHRRPTPRALGVRVSDEIERVLCRALAVEPDRRFPNVRAFWSALTEAMSIADRDATIPFVLQPDRSIHAPAQTKTPHRRRANRHWKWVPAVLVAAITIAIGMGPGHVTEPRTSAARMIARGPTPVLNH
jgi:eukaryotic-like serine/threonine-protein kinase